MTPEDLKELLELLKSAGPSDPCPICSSGAYCHCEDWLDAEVRVERLRSLVDLWEGNAVKAERALDRVWALCDPRSNGLPHGRFVTTDDLRRAIDGGDDD